MLSPQLPSSSREWPGSLAHSPRAGLLQVAKTTREDTRFPVQFYLVLQPLTAAVPRHPNLYDHENAVRNILLDQWAEKDAEAALH